MIKIITKQAFNTKTKAWVKFKTLKGGKVKFTNVKQKNPSVPFKNVPKVMKKRR